MNYSKQIPGKNQWNTFWEFQSAKSRGGSECWTEQVRKERWCWAGQVANISQTWCLGVPSQDYPCICLLYWRPTTAPELSCEAQTFTEVCSRHRIIGSFRLEKTLKTIKSDHKPEVAKPSIDPDLGIARCSPGSHLGMGFRGLYQEHSSDEALDRQ